MEPVTWGRRLPGRGLVDDSDLRDEELVARLRRRDVGAFETLYDRYGNLVYSVSLRVLGNVEAAEDVVQEVFLRLWRKPQHYDTARGKFVTWLMSVTRNRAIDEQRKRGRRQRREAPSDPELDDTLPGDESDDPAAAVLGNRCLKAAFHDDIHGVAGVALLEKGLSSAQGHLPHVRAALVKASRSIRLVRIADTG